LPQFPVRQAGAGVDFPPAADTPAVPDQGVKPGVAVPAPVKIASTKPEFGLTGGTPGRKLENLNRVAATGAGMGGWRKHTQKTAWTGNGHAGLRR